MGEKLKRDRTAYCAARKEVKAAYDAAYREAHRQERASYGAAHYAEHKGAKAAVVAAYRETHREELATAAAAYARLHPEKKKAAVQKRRATRAGNGGGFTAAEWLALVDHYGGRCLCCGRDDVRLAADHVVPLSRGGSGGIDNIQPLCQSCNSSKGTRTVDYRPIS